MLYDVTRELSPVGSGSSPGFALRALEPPLVVTLPEPRLEAS